MTKFPNLIPKLCFGIESDTKAISSQIALENCFLSQTEYLNHKFVASFQLNLIGMLLPRHLIIRIDQNLSLWFVEIFIIPAEIAQSHSKPKRRRLRGFFLIPNKKKFRKDRGRSRRRNKLQTVKSGKSQKSAASFETDCLYVHY